MPDGDSSLFTVTDLKQYIYCPRILFYHTCLPDIRPVTVKMRAGISAHEDEHKRSARRTMCLDNILSGERQYDLSLQSAQLGLSGQLDEVIWLDDEAIPVEYKLARRAGFHFKVQLAAHALLLESVYGVQVRRGLLYLIQARKTEEVPIAAKLRRAVIHALEHMRAIAEQEAIPEPTEWRQRCIECEFRRFCNDV
jgi:CRISPR-associated exonuclease Cas4